MDSLPSPTWLPTVTPSSPPSLHFTMHQHIQREMLKEDSNGGSNKWVHVCDMCHSAPSTLYCWADSAYLCTGCDARIHAANWVASCHERVRICEGCERVPAAFLCKTDAASFCSACDADIHFTNSMAHLHYRVPILPTHSDLYSPPATKPRGSIVNADDMFLTQVAIETIDGEDKDEAASWLLLNPVKNDDTNNNNNINLSNKEFLFGGEGVDEYLDLVDYNLCQDNNNFSTDQYTNQQQHYSVLDQKGYGSDSVVPVQCGERNDQLLQQQTQSFQLGMENETKTTVYGYPASISDSHTVSISSLDVSVVPESTMSDVSISHPRPTAGTIDLFSGLPIQMAPQLMSMDREARVLRYREKKKTRKFQKTIRYASRKAYAETRPRIKGRFTKRTDTEVEVDQMFSTTLMTETGYGIVLSF